MSGISLSGIWHLIIWHLRLVEAAYALGEPAGEVVDVVAVAGFAVEKAAGLLQKVIEQGYKKRFTRFVEEYAKLVLSKVSGVYHLVKALADEQAIYPRAEGFDKVKGEGRSVVLVGMEQAEVRVEPGGKKGAFYHGVEHTIEVVERSVEGVFGRLSAALGKVAGLGQGSTQRLPVSAGELGFIGHQGVSTVGEELPLLLGKVFGLLGHFLSGFVEVWF